MHWLFQQLSRWLIGNLTVTLRAGNFCITYSLIFWSRKVFEGVQNHVRSCFAKGKFGPFFCFSKFRITCQKASLVHIQIDQSCLFWIIWITLERCFQKASLVQFFLRIWTKLAFSNNLNMDQTCLLTRDPKFRKAKKWTKFAFCEATSHVILDSFKHVW